MLLAYFLLDSHIKMSRWTKTLPHISTKSRASVPRGCYHPPFDTHGSWEREHVHQRLPEIVCAVGNAKKKSSKQMERCNLVMERGKGAHLKKKTVLWWWLLMVGSWNISGGLVFLRQNSKTTLVF